MRRISIVLHFKSKKTKYSSQYQRAFWLFTEISTISLLADAFHGPLTESKLALGQWNALITEFSSPARVAATNYKIISNIIL